MAVPDVPTLAIADNGDATGATATVSDATAGTTNTIFVMAVNGDFGTGTWVEVDDRSGDGTVDLPIDPGYYWGYCLSENVDGQAASTVVYFQATTGLGAVWERCLTGVQSRIRLLSLDDIASASVVVRELPLKRFIGNCGVPLPAVLVTPATAETMPNVQGTNSRDDVGYPVSVIFMAKRGQNLASFGDGRLWREKVARAFRNQRLTGVSEVFNCQVEPGAAAVPAALLEDHHIQVLTLRFFSREPRGF